MFVNVNLINANPSKAEFLISSSPQQVSNVSNLPFPIYTSFQAQHVHSARNLGIVFDRNLSFHDLSYLDLATTAYS